jgi:hypothetical protein
MRIQQGVDWERMIEEENFRSWVKDMAAIGTWYVAGAIYIGIYIGVYECGN